MTPEQFLAIFQQFNFKLKHAPNMLPDTPAKTIQQWANGTKIIPPAIADRLRYLSVAHETLKIQAIEEAEAASKAVFWPTYLHESDFKTIDPQQYEIFLGCPRVFSQALIAAESAFLYMTWMGSKIKGNVHTYSLTARAYFSWLDHYGLPNTKANRSHFAEQSYELHRPPTDEEFESNMQQLINSPTTSSRERRYANNIIRIHMIAKAKHEKIHRQGEAEKPQISTSAKVVEDFFARHADA